MNSKIQTANKLTDDIKDLFSKTLCINKSDLKLQDGFFNLGGDSLRLVNLLELIQRRFNVSIDIRHLYKRNSIEEIAKLISFFLRHPNFQKSRTSSTQKVESFKLSFEQQQIWLAHNVSPNKSLYNIPWLIEIKGELNEPRLSLALENIAQGQQLFKCSIQHTLKAQLHNYVPFNFKIIESDEKTIDDDLTTVINNPFDLEIAPLYCFRLFKTKNRYVLCCIFHHLIIDSQSLNIFSDLLGQLYKNPTLEVDLPTYTDYVAYQQAVLSNPPSIQIRKFWNSHIADNEKIIKLPRINQCASEKVTQNSICSMSFNIDKKIFEKSKTFTNRNNLTLFPFFFSIFSIIISRYINQHHFYVALPMSTRLNGSFSNALGLFITLLPHKNSIDENSEFINYVHNAAEELIKLYRNGYIPHITLQTLSALTHDEFGEAFNIAFTVDNEAALHLDGLETRILPSTYVGYKFDLTFFIKVSHDSPRILLEFNPEKFSKTVITSLFKAFCYVTEYVLSRPNTTIYEIPLTHQSKLSIIKKTPIENDKTILHILAEVTENHHERIALEHDEREITFYDLDKKSNQFANYLKKSGLVSGDKVALYMKHSIDLIICILGVLKARCAYIPIHPSTPTDRIHYCIDQSDAKIVIIDSHFYADDHIPRINVNDFFRNIQNYSDKWELTATPNDLAYIIFTSGSTGHPKGVMVKHANLVNLFSQTNRIFNFDKNDCWLLFHSYSFDFSVWEIFGALLNGAKLIIPDETHIRSPEHLYNLIINKNITVLNQTPSAFSIFTTEAIKNVYSCKLPLKYIIFGGETINTHSIFSWLKYFPSYQTKLVNMYGITEGSIHITYQLIDENSIRNNDYGTPIGKPLLGNNIVLLDNHNLEVPTGFTGEMYIFGKSVAHGYVKNQPLTSERFLQLRRFSNELFYKTGDLAVKNSDETFSYIGRNDSQIKIRGYRIELKEIESVLMDSSYIDDVVIYLDKRDALQKTLTAFVVPSHRMARPLLEIMNLKNTNPNHLIKLPNDFTVANINPSETVSLYQEIFVEKLYLKNGIQINDDSVVFDVGANIGLFSLYLGIINRKVTIYAFEPFRILCDCIEDNKKIYDLNITVRCVGLSDSAGRRRFSFFDNVTSMSTYEYDENEQDALLRSAITVGNQEAIDSIINEKLNHQYVDCNVETLSEQIDRYSLARIDLLKIDAEGAELDILKGIKNNHWNVINQIVIEVHDINGKLENIIRLLECKGFYPDFERVEKFTGVNLFMVYATRNKEKINCINDISFNQISSQTTLLSYLKEYINKKLPEYMQPTQYRVVTEIPRTINGKTDYRQLGYLLAKTQTESISSDINDLDNMSVIHVVKEAWEELLSQKITSISDNFFELGGSSLLAIQLASRLSEKLGHIINVLDIFNFPTIQKFSKNITKHLLIQEVPSNSNKVNSAAPGRIAIIGIEGIFPNADNVDLFWDNLMSGKNCLSTFTEEQHKYSKGDEYFIPVAGIIDNLYDFDAEHFKISPSEAKMLDPQQRLLLEICYLNLLNAKIDLNSKARIGVFASADQSKYVELIDTRKLNWQDKRLFNYANSRDFVSTRIAYKLGLNGPAITINTACSSSLAACAQAANSLLQDECDIAIVCASSLIFPEIFPGYFYEPDGIMSKDGKCSPFDSNASGTVPGSAVVSIILKRHADALEDSNNIIASIHSYSINNDGNDKASYAAPSISGQKNCLENIYKKFDGDINSLDFIETHGTGTRIGDAVELMALSETFQMELTNKIHLGSVKANIGHAGAASGLCGLIKAALVLHKKEIPPQINFSKWNDLSSQAEKYFKINTTPIKLSKGTRYAGVSSFGIGGTNVHLLLQSENNGQIPNERLTSSVFKNRKNFNFYSDIKTPPIKYENMIEEFHNVPSKIIHLDLIKEFLSLVANELGIDKISLEDNFFDLGGDSLIALGILSKVLKKYQIAINIDDFYKSKNFEELIVTILRSNKKNIASYSVLQDTGMSALILIHPGGGSVYQYDFFKTLPLEKLKIITIENQVLNDIESDIDSIEKMAKHYISLLDKNIFKEDFTLCGWSFGGNVAYEMAYILQQAGINPRRVIMFDSWAKYPEKYNDFKEFKNIWFHKLDKSYLFEDNLWKKMLWNRLKMLISYQPPISNIQIKLYKATEVDPALVINDDPSNFWSDITNNIKLINVDAKHQNILDVMQERNLFDNFLDLKL